LDILFGAIQQVLGAKLGVGGNTIDGRNRVLNLRLVGSQLVGVVEAFVGGVNGQFPHSS
jgi:hypothetical protein